MLIHKTPTRIQQFINFLQKCNLVVNYIPGKNLICSDTLSKAPLKEQSPKISETKLNFQVCTFKSSFPINTERLKHLEVER